MFFIQFKRIKYYFKEHKNHGICYLKIFHHFLFSIIVVNHLRKILSSSFSRLIISFNFNLKTFLELNEEIPLLIKGKIYCLYN